MPHTYTEDQLVEQPAINLDELNQSGWVSLNLGRRGESELKALLLSIATKLGLPSSTRTGNDIFDTLTPTKSKNANPKSLSKIHDVGEFPLHTDTAHWIKPCRYLLLACINPGNANRATMLMDTKQIRLDDSQIALLHSTPFRIHNGRKSFYSTILSKERAFVRFDQGCMTPTSSDGVKALDIYSQHNWSDYIKAIHWETGKVIVIDNWRILHGRQASDSTDSNRKLLRISIL